MPDISMCKNGTCPLRGRCYRALAIPSYWQSYSAFEWTDAAGEPECEAFWDIGVSDDEVANTRRSTSKSE